MAIYRGPGGAGDATADTTNQSEIAVTKAAEAAASATAAASSAGAAANSAASALASETNSQGYANAAATSAGEAAASVIEAQAVVDTIGTAVDDAQTAAEEAAASAVTAESAANDAVDSASLANDWATYTAGPVAGGEYSAKYNAQLASGYADDASDSATAADASATAAASSASTASTAATNAAAAYDSFDDRYLGAKSTAPSVDNDGNALLTGALYWNTAGGQLYVWDGSTWQAAAFSATGAVVAVNATSPISSTGGTSPTISIAQATTSTSGYLSSTDWNTFNNKGSGTVTSVGLSVPTGLSVADSPVTGSGTIAVTYSSGYAIPTTSSQTNWDTVYGWGNHASAGYLTTSSAASTYQTISGMSSYLTTSSASSTYQTIAGMSSYLTTSAAASTYASTGKAIAMAIVFGG